MKAGRLALGLRLTLGLLLPLVLAACQPKAADTLTVLAGSELKDLEPILPDIERKAGVKLSFTYTGTLDGAQRISDGDGRDLAWFSHAKYLSLQPKVAGRIKASEKIMLSPVIMGVKVGKARAWGWDTRGVTWKDIEEKAASGELKYGMSNPAASNSGFTALVGVVAALSGKGDAITEADVRAPALKSFFKGQALTAGSSGWLADAYVRDQDALDGLVNYESVLLSLNAGGKLREKLTLLYPREGIVTADYPLLLLNDAKRAAYTRLVDALKSPEIQREIMEKTLRRPVNPQVQTGSTFPKNLLVELPFPGQLSTVNAILTAYLDENRRPAHTIFVLDTSGSMDGDRLDSLKAAMDNLTGSDTTLSGRFARFQARERVSVVSFSSDVNGQQDFTLGTRGQAAPTLQAIRQYVDNLSADGGTAIYSALERAYTLAGEAAKADPERYQTIVLMTDGENNHGASQNDFLNFYRRLPAQVRAVKTFTVLYGEGSKADMQAIAEETGGRVFDGRAGGLAGAFKEIRGYQ